MARPCTTTWRGVVVTVALMLVTGCGGNSSSSNSSNAACDKAVDLQAVSLPVSQIYQSCQEWCWAATTSMVANFYNRSVQQCGLASLLAGDPSGTGCCQYLPLVCAVPICDQGAPEPAISNGLTASGIYNSFIGQALSEDRLLGEIRNGRPVMLGLRNTFVGHVVLVTAYNRTSSGAVYSGMDPFYGPFVNQTYSNLIYAYGTPAGNAYWAETWDRLSSSQDGCSPASPSSARSVHEQRNAEPSHAACDGSPIYPVRCADGGCAGNIDGCDGDTFACGADLYHCAPGTRANCCEGQFVACPEQFPVYCAAKGRCVTAADECPGQTCGYQDIACN